MVFFYPKKKLISTPDNIMKITKGLGTHTLESGLIYFNSLLRASLLYACETYVNLNEREYRLIETTEENCLIKLLETGRNCPRSILYLEVGEIPARFQIKRLMLNYLHYILQEDKSSLISKFFHAQCANPFKNDWVSNIRKVKAEINLNHSFEEIQVMQKSKYINIVESKIRFAAFIYLKNNVKTKGKEINYGDKLGCQKYLLPNKIITFEEQKILFSYRSRMNSLNYNYPGNKETQICQCGEEMINEHLYYCSVLNGGQIVQDKYEQIFNGNITEQKRILDVLEQNMKKHELYTSAQDQ